MEITELLDRAKNRANIASDYALAKVLGMTQGNLSNIRKGRAHPSNEMAVKLATLADLDEMQVIAEIELRTANNEKKREFWKGYIERRGVAACISMFLLGASIAITPEPAQGGVLQLNNYGDFSRQATDSNIHYANKRNYVRLLLRAIFFKILQTILGSSATPTGLSLLRNRA